MANKSSNDQSEDESTKNTDLVDTFNKWGNKRRSTTIGNNMALRFGRTISLGIKYYDAEKKRQKKFGLTFDDLLGRITKFSHSKQRTFFTTFQETMSIEYVSEHFVGWKDVKSDILWQLSVEMYLNHLVCKVLTAYQSHTLRKPALLKKEEFQRKLSEIQQKYVETVQLFEKRKQTALKQRDQSNDTREPPLKKRKLCTNNDESMLKIEPASMESSYISISPTSSTGVGMPPLNIPSVINPNLFANIPNFNVSTVSESSSSAVSNGNGSNIGNGTNNIDNNNLNGIAALCQRLFGVSNGMNVQSFNCESPSQFRPHLLPNISSLTDLGTSEMMQSLSNATNTTNNNGNENTASDMITVRYRIYIDGNGMSIQKM